MFDELFDGVFDGKGGTEYGPASARLVGLCDAASFQANETADRADMAWSLDHAAEIPDGVGDEPDGGPDGQASLCDSTAGGSCSTSQPMAVDVIPIRALVPPLVAGGFAVRSIAS